MAYPQHAFFSLPAHALAIGTDGGISGARLFPSVPFRSVRSLLGCGAQVGPAFGGTGAEHARGEAFLGEASSLGPQLPQRPSVSARSFRFSCRLLFGTVVDKKNIPNLALTLFVLTHISTHHNFASNS